MIHERFSALIRDRARIGQPTTRSWVEHGNLSVAERRVNRLARSCFDGSPSYHASVTLTPTPAELSQYVKRIARSVGFDSCGIAGAAPIGRSDYVREWLDRGRAGTMQYMHKYFEPRTDPTLLLKNAKSIIMVTLLYKQDGVETVGRSTPHEPTNRGRVAMYAWGDDYHKVVKTKLFQMADRMREELAEAFEVKACVDTAPLLEREVAAAAGLGWIGKNTLVLDRKLGSYFFLGGLVTTLDLAPDTPEVDHCGTCTACLDACPTGAFPAPYEMDASRCISYLTIEHRSHIADELADRMSDWVFGCDVCQEVCPHNRHAPTTREPRFQLRPPSPRLDLDDVSTWTIEDYRLHLRGSAIKRAKLDMLQRNARIARNNASS